MEVNRVENDEAMRRKANKITAMLDKRRENRIEEVAQKKSEDAERQSKLDSYDFFVQNFKQECDSLRTKLDRKDIKLTDRAEVAHYLEDLSASFEKLVKFLNDSTVFLRAFQLEQAQKTLNQLGLDISNKKQELVPKKKFAFKSKKKVENTTKPETKTTEAPTKKFDFLQDHCDISNKVDENITMRGDDINKKDVSVSKLQGCYLELRGYPGTVHLSDVKNCVVLCGPVSGSVFVDDCTNSKIVTGCQQLRVHNTTETDFYLHVTSRAIIEDTLNVHFAPFNWAYEDIDEHFLQSGLVRDTNNWNDVDDFNWLALDTASPNWSVIPENMRVEDWSKFQIVQA